MLKTLKMQSPKRRNRMTKQIQLPPLPDTDWALHMPARLYEREWTSDQEGYTADQMQTYAIECIHKITGETE
jgi:hypothetical protein